MRPRERFLSACHSKPVDRPPIWLMRQAGRYLPEYRELRSRHEFWEMMRSPELAAEVTLQPIRRFGMDAAILFSDILVVQAAMGIDVTYSQGGPVLSPLVRSESDLHALQPVDCHQSFSYITEIIRRLTAELHPARALVGFTGAPFTLAAYMMESGPSKSIDRLREVAAGKPSLYAGVLDRVSEVVTGLLALQIEAGADAVQLFDTWSGKLTLSEYRELALPWSTRVVDSLKGLGVPVILYVRNAAGNLEAAASSGCDVLAIDGSLALGQARRRLGERPALQGNFRTADLKKPAEEIRRLAKQMIEAAGPTGYIFNLGEGLTPDTPVEGVAALVEAVQS